MQCFPQIAVFDVTLSVAVECCRLQSVGTRLAIEILAALLGQLIIQLCFTAPMSLLGNTLTAGIFMPRNNDQAGLLD